MINARTLSTRNLRGSLSVLPKNWLELMLLPPNCQKFVAFSPPRLCALTFVTFAPLPESEAAVTVPEKVGLAGREEFKIEPANWVAGSVPVRLLAAMAYGAGVISCRGFN